MFLKISFDRSIPLFGLISTSSEKQALFWRFHAEALILSWDIYVFVSFDCSIPLFGLISTGSEKQALFWRFRAEALISHWDIYVFVSFDRSIPLFGLILTGSEKQALFWKFRAEVSWSGRDLMGTKFLLYLSNMLSTIGLKELRFCTWLTPSSICFNCDKSCSINSDELVDHQNRSDICWK